MTLPEVMYAVLLTGVSAGVLVAAMPAASVAYASASDEQHAINLAEKELESIRNQGFANINPSQLATVGLLDNTTAVANNTYTFSNVDSANHDNVSAILPSGAGTVQITNISLNLVQVTVIVTWVSHNRNQSYTLTTEIANL